MKNTFIWMIFMIARIAVLYIGSIARATMKMMIKQGEHAVIKTGPKNEF